MQSRDLPHIASLETDRLDLRTWEQDDFEGLVQLHTDPAVADALRRPAATSERVRKTFDYILAHWDRFGFGPWATLEKASGRLMGNVGLEHMEDWPFKDKVEVGFVLGSEFWGRGYAPEAARATVRHGFEVIGLGRIISTTYVDHWASRKVMEKCGMTFQGVIRWRDADIAWYAANRHDLGAAELTGHGSDFQSGGRLSRTTELTGTIGPLVHKWPSSPS